jgi:non-canonical (house-cleaning) NTP pyrophosphatase
MLTTHNPTKIAALNDAARKSFSGCRVCMTPGVQALYQTQAIAARVQAYDDFTERNDRCCQTNLTSHWLVPNFYE